MPDSPPRCTLAANTLRTHSYRRCAASASSAGGIAGTAVAPAAVTPAPAGKAGRAVSLRVTIAASVSSFPARLYLDRGHAKCAGQGLRVHPNAPVGGDVEHAHRHDDRYACADHLSEQVEVVGQVGGVHDGDDQVGMRGRVSTGEYVRQDLLVR